MATLMATGGFGGAFGANTDFAVGLTTDDHRVGENVDGPARLATDLLQGRGEPENAVAAADLNLQGGLLDRDLP